MDRIKIIAIAGGSGSGKTFLANAIFEKIGPSNSFVLYQDSYYIDQSDKFDHDGGSVNFDHPDSIDFSLMCDHIKKLKNFESISVPEYDFATHSRKPNTRDQSPKKMIIVDGILILCNPELRMLFDEIIFVEAPETVRFQRRLERDIVERGRTKEGVIAQFNSQVKPMHDQFVEPSKEHANKISSGTDMKAFEETLNYVTGLISE